MALPSIDLRSDTVTKPTAAMRQAMARAEVGDDVYDEDPTVRRLEERAAELLGKAQALFVPSGTMANQIALLCHCERGDEVIAGQSNHLLHYESGAGSAWAGVSFLQVGEGGLFGADDVESAIKPAQYHFARSRLVAIENTHNRGGGRVFPQRDVEAIAELAHARGLALHLDGARVWNAAIATGQSPAELAAPADSVSACFSKGLGAPVGSVIAGPAALRVRAHRFRKMLGGGMRQAGVIAAAALHALEHHRERLAEDHANARRLAEGIANIAHLACDPSQVDTNIVMFTVAKTAAMSAQDLVVRLDAAGVRMNAVSPRQLRAVTHLDVVTADIDRALDAIARCVAEQA